MLKRTSAALVMLMVMATGAACQAATPPAKQAPLMKDYIGMNVHTIQFKPELYRPALRLVRDYHGLQWDILEDSSQETTFPMSRAEITWKDDSGLVGDHKGLVDWKKLYSSWQAKGIEIDACVMLGEFTIDKWADVEADAYRYGKAFAEYFGPSGEALVTSVEIGNEPAGAKRYSPEDYERVFKAMARGIRDGDPKLTILTATTQAGRPDGWSLPTEMFAPYGDLYDVINVHVYSLVEGWPTWKRSFPEDPSIEYLKIVQRTIEWRDTHAPDKEIWITEFGYDSSTKQPDPEGRMAKFVDVSDLVQAQWLIRSYLEFARMGVERAYVYWFNDSDSPALHAASGIMRFNKPKMSFHAIKQMQDLLGKYRFNRVVQRDNGKPFIYEFVNGSDAKDVVWVAWLAGGVTNDTDKNPSQQIVLELPGKLVSAQAMATAEGDAPAAEVKTDDGKTAVTISESPVYLHIKAE